MVCNVLFVEIKSCMCTFLILKFPDTCVVMYRCLVDTLLFVLSKKFV